MAFAASSFRRLFVAATKPPSAAGFSPRIASIGELEL